MSEADEARALEEIRAALRTKTVLVDEAESRRIVESMGAGSRVLDELNRNDDLLAADAERNRLLRRTQRTLLGLTGFGLGMVGRTIERLGFIQPDTPLLGRVLIPMSALTLTLWIYNRIRGTHRSYQYDNALLWAGFTAGWSVLLTSTPGNAIAGLVGWGVSSLLGAVTLGRKKDDATDS